MMGTQIMKLMTIVLGTVGGSQVDAEMECFTKEKRAMMATTMMETHVAQIVKIETEEYAEGTKKFVPFLY